MPPIDTLAGADTEAQPDDLRGDIAALFEGEAAPATIETVADEGAPAAVDAKFEERVVENRLDHPTDPARYADGTFKRTKAEAAAEKPAPADGKPVTEQPSTDNQAKASEAVSNRRRPSGGMDGC